MKLLKTSLELYPIPTRLGLYLCFIGTVTFYRELFTMVDQSYCPVDTWFSTNCYIAWPQLRVSAPTCILPANWVPVKDAASLFKRDGKQATQLVCFPESAVAKKAELVKLHDLLDFMRQESKDGLGLAAPHVGIPARLLFFEKVAMLNPRIKNPEGETECTFEPVFGGPPQKTRGPLRMTLEYETLAGLTQEVVIKDDFKACGVVMLMQAF